jgi:hypothetical protein
MFCCARKHGKQRPAFYTVCTAIWDHLQRYVMWVFTSNDETVYIVIFTSLTICFDYQDCYHRRCYPVTNVKFVWNILFGKSRQKSGNNFLWLCKSTIVLVNITVSDLYIRTDAENISYYRTNRGITTSFDKI